MIRYGTLFVMSIFLQALVVTAGAPWMVSAAVGLCSLTAAVLAVYSK